MMRRVTLSGVGVVVVAGLVWWAADCLASTVQGGGKNLTKIDATFASEPIPTGGGNSDNVYVFNFTAEFPVDDVHVTFENQDGKPVSGSGNDISSIKIKNSSGTEVGSKTCSGSGDSTGSCDSTSTIAAGQSFTVEVDADANNLANVRFRISFTQKQANKNSMVVPEMNTGHCALVAVPVTETVEGGLLTVRNTSGDVVTFGRFDLVGLSGITVTGVSASGFTAEIDLDGRGFTLSGTLAINAAVEVVATFSGLTTDRGAVLARFDHN